MKEDLELTYAIRRPDGDQWHEPLEEWRRRLLEDLLEADGRAEGAERGRGVGKAQLGGGDRGVGVAVGEVDLEFRVGINIMTWNARVVL